jgi:hypothetical protein
VLSLSKPFRSAHLSYGSTSAFFVRVICVIEMYIDFISRVVHGNGNAASIHIRRSISGGYDKWMHISKDYYVVQLNACNYRRRAGKRLLKSRKPTKHIESFRKTISASHNGEITVFQSAFCDTLICVCSQERVAQIHNDGAVILRHTPKNITPPRYPSFPPLTSHINVMLKISKKKCIQQRVFASGHPPSY